MYLLTIKGQETSLEVHPSPFLWLYNIWCWWKKSTGTFFYHKNNIKLLLYIQDKNSENRENAGELRSYQGRMAKFITAKLTYTPAYCECCGVKNEDYTIYKNGTKTSRITLPISGVYTTYLN